MFLLLLMRFSGSAGLIKSNLILRLQFFADILILTEFMAPKLTNEKHLPNSLLKREIKRVNIFRSPLI